jgi:hypothetical protein
MKWLSIWSINEIFISITTLKTKIQKERPLHVDLSSTNQVFNMNDMRLSQRWLWRMLSSGMLRCVELPVFLRNVSQPKFYTVPHPRRQHSSSVQYDHHYVCNFFSTNCDVDYSTAHTPSYLVAGLNDLCSQIHHCLRLFWKNLFLKESPKKVVTSV